MRRPLIARQSTAALVGVGLLVAGCVVLWDAYEGRGAKKPWALGPFVPF